MSEGRSAEELWRDAHTSVTRGDLIGGIRLLADCYERLDGDRDRDPRVAQVHARWQELYEIFTTLRGQSEGSPAVAKASTHAGGSEADQPTRDSIAASVFGEELLAGEELAEDKLFDAEAHGQGDVDGGGADEALEEEILDAEFLEGDDLEAEVQVPPGVGGASAPQDPPRGNILGGELFGDDLRPAASSVAMTVTDGDNAGRVSSLAGPEPIRVEARSVFEEAKSLAEQAESSVNEGDLAAGIALYERLVDENPGNELVAERLAELRAAAAHDETQSAGPVSWSASPSTEEPLAGTPLHADAPSAAVDDDVAFLHELLRRVQDHRRAL